jgi:hypothetical protein
MKGGFALIAVLVTSLSLVASSRAREAGFPPPALVKRLAERSLVVTPARPGDHPRVTLTRAIATAHVKKPFLVYALRLTDTEYGNYPNLIIKDRLVWLFVVPHVRFPIFGTCQVDCFYYADEATVVDATSGKWLLAVSLGS